MTKLVLVAAARLGCSTNTIYHRADRFASVRDALQICWRSRRWASRAVTPSARSSL